ncbi:MAG: hypothetical protein V4754_18765 [Pseudomonadota bacterium]
MQPREYSPGGANRPSLLSATEQVDAGWNGILSKLEIASATKAKPATRALPMVHGWNAIGAGALALVAAVAIWGVVASDDDSVLTGSASLAARSTRDAGHDAQPAIPAVSPPRPLAIAALMAAPAPSAAPSASSAPGMAALAPSAVVAAAPTPASGATGSGASEDGAAPALAVADKPSLSEMMNKGKRLPLAAVAHPARKPHAATVAAAPVKTKVKHPAGKAAADTRLAAATSKTKGGSKDGKLHASAKETRLAAHDRVKSTPGKARPKPEQDSDVALLAAVVAFSQRSGSWNKNDGLTRDSPKEITR